MAHTRGRSGALSITLVLGMFGVAALASGFDYPVESAGREDCQECTGSGHVWSEQYQMEVQTHAFNGIDCGEGGCGPTCLLLQAINRVFSHSGGSGSTVVATSAEQRPTDAETGEQPPSTLREAAAVARRGGECQSCSSHTQGCHEEPQIDPGCLTDPGCICRGDYCDETGSLALVENLRPAIDAGDEFAVKRLLTAASGKFVLDQGRSLIVVSGCGGRVVARLRVPGQMFRLIGLG